MPDELAAALRQETIARQQAEAKQERQRAEDLKAQLARYQAQFGDLPD